MEGKHRVIHSEDEVHYDNQSIGEKEEEEEEVTCQELINAFGP